MGKRTPFFKFDYFAESVHDFIVTVIKGYREYSDWPDKDLKRLHLKSNYYQQLGEYRVVFNSQEIVSVKNVYDKATDSYRLELNSLPADEEIINEYFYRTYIQDRLS